MLSLYIHFNKSVCTHILNLHKWSNHVAPTHVLHESLNVWGFLSLRFYSHNSSFVHGGVEKPGEEQPPVVGQAVSVFVSCFTSAVFQPYNGDVTG